jgi:hypothetical protein
VAAAIPEPYTDAEKEELFKIIEQMSKEYRAQMLQWAKNPTAQLLLANKGQIPQPAALLPSPQPSLSNEPSAIPLAATAHSSEIVPNGSHFTRIPVAPPSYSGNAADFDRLSYEVSLRIQLAEYDLTRYLDRPYSSWTSTEDLNKARIVWCQVAKVLPPGLQYFTKMSQRDTYDPQHLFASMKVKFRGITPLNASNLEVQYQKMRYTFNDDFTAFRYKLEQILGHLAALGQVIPDSFRKIRLLNTLPQQLDYTVPMWAAQCQSEDFTFPVLCDTIDATILQNI